MESIFLTSSTVLFPAMSIMCRLYSRRLPRDGLRGMLSPLSVEFLNLLGSLVEAPSAAVSEER
jgi:hypothetical protein